MKKKFLPVFALAMFGLGTHATTYMIVKQADGSEVEYDVEKVVEVTYRKDSVSTGDDDNPIQQAPCITMCDNEFAVKTMRIKGDNLSAPLKAKFWDGKDYTIEASTKDGSIMIHDQYDATITIPAGVKDGGHIVFENEYGETISDFIYRDTRNMLITHDDEDLKKHLGLTPDSTLVYVYEGDTTFSGMIEPKETIIKKYFQSDNTNGNFSIFHRDGDDFVGLSYEPYDTLANPKKENPKYATPFGVFAKDILSGKTTPNDYVIKFEVFVSSEAPMQGDALNIGFFNSVNDNGLWDARGYCSCWQPSRAVYPKDEDGIWNNSSVTCDAWSCPDWMTVTIPMEDLLYNFIEGNYRTNPQDGRRETDGSCPEYKYFGDSENGLPFFEKNNNYVELFDGGTPLDLGDPSVTGLAITLARWDCPIQDTDGRHPYIAVDNVRIVPKDNNGGVWKLTDWGTPTRDFYTKPITSCK